ncbi:uncharacterized protein Z520_00657 [Fonsecaea multimorphosa CBS 102226]|uniref:Uncharacterized protein n=1 Tax=Fonsecaea multimorphosa CBS 102226 TaxID=1442371 RepID=A0A0D2KKI1_9EURO|nr:uncharacterized protein Z520_00657 [Fonsecaea multimorphosa CBS 102226]KIY03965.1 hypothetical protein Z520_00657 [Fonsecaea multimorphosa CBS 102226]OAL31805.1 hypothetical protein AYO22_00675 [Fonsecaea multimorphosa]
MDDDMDIDGDFLPACLPKHELCDWFAQNNHAGFEAALLKRQDEILRLARVRHGLALMSVPPGSSDIPLVELIVIKDMIAYTKEIQHLLEIAHLFQIRIAIHHGISRSETVLRRDFRRSLAVYVANSALLFAQDVIDAQVEATGKMPLPPPGRPLKYCDSPSCNAIFLTGIPGNAIVGPGAWVVSCQTPHHHPMDADQFVAWAWGRQQRATILGHCAPDGTLELD